MSFRDTFTRNESGNENLQYDDIAFHHFFITILLVIFIPLFYNIIKTILNPFGHVPKLKEMQQKKQFKDKIQRFKKQNKYSYLNCKFFFKVLLFILFLIVVIYGIIFSFITIQQSSTEIKGFDPYEILGVEQDAPVEKIKKAYRKLALLYHPDRNQDNPQASAKFIMISKAYECLTNQQAKEKCLKYGNPQGSNSFNVGIALPSFLIKKQNHVFIMGIVFFIVVIVLPVFLIQYFSDMNKYDDFGMLSQNYAIFNEYLNQHFSVKDCIKTYAICMQFKTLKTTRNQFTKLQQLLSKANQQISKPLKTKNFHPYIKKSMLLLSARMNQQQITEQIQQDLKFILKKLPIILKASVFFGFSRSVPMSMYRNQKFVGFNAIQSIIWFGQYFIQGKSFQTSESFEQINLTKDQVDRIYKKKKNKKITDLQTLFNNESQRQYFMNIIDQNRRPYIKQCIDYFPKNTIRAQVKKQEDIQLCVQDSIKILITITSSRVSSYCSSTNYPFLKQQGWYIIAINNNFIVFLDHFNFDTCTKQFTVDLSHGKQGKYDLSIHLLSDCYFGLDQEINIKYQVKPVRQVKDDQTKDQNQNEQQDQSFLRKMLESIVPQQEEEVSDKQDNDQEDKKSKNNDKSKEITQ